MKGVPVCSGNFIQVARLRAVGQQARPGREDSRRGTLRTVVGHPRDRRETG